MTSPLGGALHHLDHPGVEGDGLEGDILEGGGLERPIAVRFSPDGTSLYVVDFGVMTVGERGPQPKPETGVLWRITRSPAQEADVP